MSEKDRPQAKPEEPVSSWLGSAGRWPLLAGFAVGVFIGVLLRD